MLLDYVRISSENLRTNQRPHRNLMHLLRLRGLSFSVSTLLGHILAKKATQGIKKRCLILYADNI